MLKYINKRRFFSLTSLALLSLASLYILRRSQKKKKKLDNQDIEKLTKKRYKGWYNTIDSSSVSNLDEVYCDHYDHIIYIDFNNKVLNGSTNYQFSALKNTLVVQLDIRNIEVKQCFMNNQKLIFNIQKVSEQLGDQLNIFLCEDIEKGNIFHIQINYTTINSQNSALNWLNPQQTKGKLHPYLFTQCEPIYARSIFPCMDSPSVKSTFQTQIHVNNPLKAYVSGVLIHSQQQNSNIQNFSFQQNIPIPSYLFAIVAGNLEEKKVSERTSVIAEPEVVEEYSKELEDMEFQLQTLENLITKYVWEQYKVVVLPPSFPYGGMENPLLTFASPSIIAGDKSGIDVIIHEMAHSWSGNLVSCKNWDSFWLNEGWTVFFELETLKQLKGINDYKLRCAILDQELKNQISYIGVSHSYTSLNPQVKHENPDDAFSSVPYYKGFQFLKFLQELVGEDKFMKFYKSYINKFQFQSITTEDFKNFFKSFFGYLIYKQINWEEWLNKAGYPPKTYDYSDEEVVKLPIQLATKFLHNDLDNQTLEDLSKQWNQFNNPEIYIKWILAALCAKYDTILPFVETHLKEHGRMKFVKCVYQSLITNYGADYAKKVFDQNQSLYYGLTLTSTQSLFDQK
ncbi:leukotriene a4 hydrolase, putative [Ichthyophthirius multifiliis]|uniref:Leukotriene a4 hydrolase, putative n=1 Tax=Ichthyophthirius multifiliis TaxID=5932 RepID=G0QUF8_ICHMU|nr:leukotriene a4 hydrolase, putative [Ichthyophthirius multifiliis]EGR31154.1 leukotriene a4 hydrolase, putative [Ichthyophthirius multifiliis]|eukprot:XP_004034640.1 leukotriene a4 hydrolase, putative [Ichthyophthirius multifiliis]